MVAFAAQAISETDQTGTPVAPRITFSTEADSKTTVLMLLSPSSRNTRVILPSACIAHLMSSAGEHIQC